MSEVNDEEHLARALSTLKRLVPTCAAVQLQTSDQKYHGFVLTGVVRADGTVIDHTNDPARLDQLAEAVHDDLTCLAWDGVAGEDQYGHALVPAPGSTTAPPP